LTLHGTRPTDTPRYVVASLRSAAVTMSSVDHVVTKNPNPCSFRYDTWSEGKMN